MPSDRTQRELTEFQKIISKIEKIKNFLIKEKIPKDIVKIKDFYDYLRFLKNIIKNFNMDISFSACLLVKDYLMKNFSFSREIDAAHKPQGAKGLDIDEKLYNGKRLIAEIKATYPYKKKDFGAQQKESIFKDFKKLNKTKADYKFFFVSEEKSFSILKDKYKEEFKEIRLVLVPKGEIFIYK
ncbi:MAG: hypothetical protein JXA99_12510 [Candidatus Lokiarchaeota archaeon]|nr:hypothetical protein [Candidatus Lokiarchaeota archaeon]